MQSADASDFTIGTCGRIRPPSRLTAYITSGTPWRAPRCEAADQRPVDKAATTGAATTNQLPGRAADCRRDRRAVVVMPGEQIRDAFDHVAKRDRADTSAAPVSSANTISRRRHQRPSAQIEPANPARQKSAIHPARPAPPRRARNARADAVSCSNAAAASRRRAPARPLLAVRASRSHANSTAGKPSPSGRHQRRDRNRPRSTRPAAATRRRSTTAVGLPSGWRAPAQRLGSNHRQGRSRSACPM